MVYYLFATHLAFGALVSQAFVPIKVTGGGFPRFIGGIAAFFLVTGVLVPMETRSETALWLYRLTVIPAAVQLLFKEERAAVRTGLWIAAIALAAAAFTLDAIPRFPAGGSPLLGAVTFASFLASALSMGSVSVAMILGHFYLNIPGLSIRPLIRLCRLLIVSLVMRLLIGAAVVLTFGPTATGLSDARATAHLWNGLSVDEGLVFWPRFLAGLLAPLVLAFLAWRTARIRSTQSATGILYVAVVFTTIGEFLGRFLLATTGLPL